MTANLVVKAARVDGRYGTREIRTLYPRYASIGILIAVMMHLAVFVGIYLYQSLTPVEILPSKIGVTIYRCFPQFVPPPINPVPMTGMNISYPGVKTVIGVPVPVPDAVVNADKTIPTQNEFSNANPVTATGNDGAIGIGSPDASLSITDADPSPTEFIFVEKDPVPVKAIVPVYPRLGIDAGIEGKVTVRMLVDKNGRVKKAFIQSSDVEIFNDPALEAALHYVFTPAIQNGRAIPVWVSVPFRFTLKK